MDKAIATVAVWLGPALACEAVNEPLVAFAFILSLVGTIAIWAKIS